METVTISQPLVRPRAPRYTWLLVASLVVLVAAVGLLYQGRLPIGGGNDVQASLVVLPLENLTGDPGQDYLSDGITDSLITELGSISALKVISRTSARQYKNATMALPDIARELGVGHVVEGAVSRAGEQLEISLRLMDAAADRPLWTRRFERDTAELSVLPSELARALAQAMNVTLTKQEEQVLTDARTVSPEAYEEFVKGVAQYDMRSSGLTRALAHFQRAVQLEPAYAEAWAYLGRCFMAASIWGEAIPQDVYPKAKAAAERALELNERLGFAHYAMASVKWVYEWDFEGGEREARRARNLSPGDAEILSVNAQYAAFILRRWDEAITLQQQARELDPLSGAMDYLHGVLLSRAGRYQEAIDFHQRLLQIAHQPWFHGTLTDVYLWQGRYDDAIAEVEEFREEMGELHPEIHSALGYAYAKQGRRDDALRVLAEMEEDARGKPAVAHSLPGWQGRVYIGLGDTDKAFEELEEAFRRRLFYIIMIRLEPYCDSIRSDPRFGDLMKRVGLQP